MIASRTRIGGYEILDLLGTGGMGEVYLARDTRLGREVALKVLPPDLASDPERLARFEREARTVASLSHPNIVTLHSIEDADGLRFITMERVTGRPLSDLIAPEGMPLARALEIAIPIVDALAAAHQHGIVHRDLKPANVMVNDEGRVKVLDFGLAKPQAEAFGGDVAGPTETVTTDGRIVGTVPYMAPEQLRGERVDPRADIFSFGVMLYEMAAGTRPFRGESAVDVVSAILRADPDPLDHVRPQLPLRFVQLVRRCLEKTPQRRAQSAIDLRHELQDLADEVRTGLRPSSTPSGVAAAQGTPMTGGSASSGVAVQAAHPSALGSSVPVPATTGTASAAASRRWLAWAGAVAAALAVVALAIVAVPRLRQGGEPPPGGAIESLAVLPFANMSQDASQDFFVEGIHEALITDLARLGTLKVTSRNSVQRYKGKTLQLKEVARELGVDALIEGSVLRAGNKVRITAQLILGATDEHAWADSYDRDVQDVLVVLSDVSGSIAREVQARVGGSTRPVDATPITRQPASARRVRQEALDAYLRGRQAFNHGVISAGTSTRYLTESIASARKLFEDATRLDPQYADAWSGLAFTTMSQGFFGVRGLEETLPVAREAAGKALEIDPLQGEAYGTLGILDLFFEWHFEKARLEFEKAIALNPYDVHIRHGYADYLVAHGHARQSLEQLRIARGHNPNSPWAHLLVLTHLQLASRDWSEVLAEARRVQAAFPTLPMVPGIMSDCLWRDGQHDAALAVLRRVDPETANLMDAALRRGGPQAAARAVADDAVAHVTPRTRPFGIAALLADAGDRDAAFAWLDKAFVARQPQLLYLPARAEFDSMRDDPRYLDLLRRMGLPIK